MMLHALIVQRYRALGCEESRLLSGVWRSVSTALRAELKDADATPPATPCAGAPVLDLVQWAHQNRALLLQRARQGPPKT